MELTFLQIKNFKSIENLMIKDIENALILVGQNSVGKSSILAAIAAAMGQYTITPSDFNEKHQNIEISMVLSIFKQDLSLLYKNRRISAYKRRDTWYRDFCQKLPS